MVRIVGSKTNSRQRKIKQQERVSPSFLEAASVTHASRPHLVVALDSGTAAADPIYSNPYYGDPINH